MDLLRIAGVPGAGKSAVAWEIFCRLTEAGAAASYIDIDQLGMCYPARDDDPQRWLLKEHALVRVAARFAAAGCTDLVVSGVADPMQAPPAVDFPASSLWLDVDERTQRERLLPRGWPQHQVDAVVADSSIRMTGLHHAWVRHASDRESLAETVDAVFGRWARTSDQPADFTAPAPAGAEGRVLWITGPRGVGASRVAWEIVSAVWRAGVPAGFVDVRQLAFANGTDGHTRIGVANAADMHSLFVEAGARLFVVVAPFEIGPEVVASAFPDADVTFIRLDADAATLRLRIDERTRGGGPILAGDDLIGATPEEAETILAEALRQRDTAPRHGEVLLDTTGRAPADLAQSLFSPAELSVS